MSKELGATFIVLIPKKTGAISIRDSRPISLIGSFYYILAKVLAKRFRSVLSFVISLKQEAFVDNRQIIDTIFITHDGIHS